MNVTTTKVVLLGLKFIAKNLKVTEEILKILRNRFNSFRMKLIIRCVIYPDVREIRKCRIG